MSTNPRQFQTMYLRASIPADTYIRRPAGVLYPSWDQQNESGIGTYARYMGPLPPEQPGNVRVGKLTWAAIPAGVTQYCVVAQFLSDPLEAVTIPAARWRISWAIRLANASATFKWSGLIAIYAVNGRTGERRATIIPNDASTGLLINNDERTADFFTMGMACELLTGDYLECEVATLIENSGGAPVVPDLSAYFDGTTPITIFGTATTNPQAVCIPPVPLVRVLPYPSEQPDASVTEDQARELAVAGFPPGILHEFGSPAAGQAKSPDAQLMDWIGTLYKRWSLDFLDIWSREMDPAQANLKLDDWRDLYELVANPARRRDLAALIVARLREIGVPSSLFGVAASVGTVLGYANPTQLEELEYDANTARNALTYVFPLLTPVAVPLGANFAAGLRFESPYPYDAGPIWPSGAKVFLTFSADVGQAINVRLTGPDGAQKTWTPITQTHNVSSAILFALEFAGRSSCGTWTVEIFRSGGPAVNLVGLGIYAPGCPRSEALGPAVPPAVGPPWPVKVPNAETDCGAGRHRMWWGVYVDPALVSIKTAADYREARAALSRIRHAYQRADLILTKSAIPGTPHAIPGAFIPG
mgnify:CR=1 FL=1